jgi:hypothetical protein
MPTFSYVRNPPLAPPFTLARGFFPLKKSLSMKKFAENAFYSAYFSRNSLMNSTVA